MYFYTNSARPGRGRAAVLDRCKKNEGLYPSVPEFAPAFDFEPCVLCKPLKAAEMVEETVVRFCLRPCKSRVFPYLTGGEVGDPSYEEFTSQHRGYPPCEHIIKIKWRLLRPNSLDRSSRSHRLGGFVPTDLYSACRGVVLLLSLTTLLVAVYRSPRSAERGFIPRS